MDVLVQRDFSGGSNFDVARELIPDSAFAYAINALLDEDGTVYRRGGSAYKSGSNFGATLTFLWDGYLVGGSRTVFASSADFGVLDSDDSTVINLGGLGCDGQRAAAGGGLLFILNGASGTAGQVTVYGGSRKTAAYTTGTITTTSGSKTVTGSGTSFSANVDAGMILTSGGAVLGVVSSVDSNTQITLKDATRSVVTTAAYSLDALYTYTPFGAVTLTAIAYIGLRLVGATGPDIRFLPATDYTTGAGPFSSWTSTDFWRIAGASIIAMEPLRHTLLVFTTQGVWAISNMDLDLTDPAGNPQQRLEQISKDLVCVDGRGIAGWNGSLVVPCTDDIYLVNEAAAPVPIGSRARKRYRDHLASDYTVAFCTVFRNHLFVPVVNGTTWVDTLVLKLDGGGWTLWDGHGGTSLGFATRAASGAARSPELLSINAQRVLNLSSCFTPSSANKNEADGTTHEWTLVTRDYTLDALRKALVKKVRARYELNDAGSDNPTISLEYGTGQVVTGSMTWGASTWGASTWGTSSEEQFSTISGDAPEDNGVTPYVWPVVTGGAGVRPRFARFRLRSSDPSAKLVLRSLELFVRKGSRQ